MFIDAEGVPVDTSRGLKLWERACEGGEAVMNAPG